MIRRLLLDVQALQTNSGERGVGRYLVNLVRGLRQARPELRLELVTNAHLPPLDRARLVDGVEWLQYTPPFPSLGFAAGAGWRRASSLHFADWLSARRADAVLLGSCFELDTIVPEFVGTRPPVAAIVYDLIPLLFPELYLPDASRQAWYGERLGLLLALDGLLAISRHTAGDVHQVLGVGPERVTPIGGALDPDFAPVAAAPPDRPFVFVLAQEDPRKDVASAVRAWSSLPRARRDDLDLVIAGVLGETTELEVARLAAASDAAAGVRLVGRVTDAELRRLYATCRVFLFPSLYEGLGLPLLEALACGAPVVARATSSVPEFAGPDAFLAASSSPDDLAAALARALDEPGERRRPARVDFARAFRWDVTARTALQALERLTPPAPVDADEEWGRRVTEALGAPDRTALTALLERWLPQRRAGRGQVAPPRGAHGSPPALAAWDLDARRTRALDLARRLLAPGPRRAALDTPFARLEDNASLDVGSAEVLPPGAGPLRRTLHRLLILAARPWLARQTRFNQALVEHLRGAL